MQEQKIYGRREGSVGHLVFNTPAKLNAVSPYSLRTSPSRTTQVSVVMAGTL